MEADFEVFNGGVRLALKGGAQPLVESGFVDTELDLLNAGANVTQRGGGGEKFGVRGEAQAGVVEAERGMEVSVAERDLSVAVTQGGFDLRFGQGARAISLIGHDDGKPSGVAGGARRRGDLILFGASTKQEVGGLSACVA